MPDLKKKVLVQCHGCQWYWRTKYVEGRCPRCNRMGDLTNEERNEIGRGLTTLARLVTSALENVEFKAEESLRERLKTQTRGLSL